VIRPYEPGRGEAPGESAPQPRERDGSKTDRIVTALIGPAVTLACVLTLAVLAGQGVTVQNPVLFLALAIVFSSFLGGAPSGLASVGVSFAFVLVYWSVPGRLFSYTGVDISRLAVFLLTMPLMAALVALLQNKNRRMVQSLLTANEAIRDGMERLARAERVACTGNWEVDVGSGGLYTSQGARLIYGITAEYATYDSVKFIPLPMYRKMLDAAMDALVHDGAPYNVEFKIRRPDDGRIVDVLSRATYDRERGRVFGIIQDVTDRKRTEAELIEAREKAEVASQAKSMFLATMSHEVRTPLNGVAGMLQVLEDSGLAQGQRRHVESALSSVRHLSQLVSDILDISQIESGRKTLAHVAFDLGALFDSVRMLFAPSASENGVALAFDVDAPLRRRVMGDEHKLRQVLGNLVGNAIKYSPQGEVRVQAGLLREDRGMIRILVAVSDTGQGIPEAFLPRLCSPFSQAAAPNDRKPGGVGLGLAIVSELVRLMQGEMVIDSQEGLGTQACLSMAFPVAPEAAQTPAGSAADAAAGRLTILLAEDDLVSRMACQHMLEKMGHTVAAAGDGLQALDLVSRQDFDILVMDNHMPGMDGLEVARAIRQDDRFRDRARVPIVIMTACDLIEEREKCLAAGAGAYVAKPLARSALQQALCEAMAAGAP
jgi:PAS domain S-box-containing protein